MAISNRRASDPEKTNFWREHVAKWRTSGLSQAEYCRQNCVSIKSLGYWKRRFERNQQPPSPSVIVPVPQQHLVQPSLRQEEGALRVHLGHRFTVEIRGDFFAPVLEKLVRTLEQLP
jgi:transposase